ncbi:MAG: hypothetical protein ABI119_05885 [Gemmatimonadaceae bacterium]
MTTAYHTLAASSANDTALLLDDFLHERYAAFVWTPGECAKGEAVQRTMGDIVAVNRVGVTVGLEVKADYTDHDNLFLETWSNRARFTSGWLVTLQSDALLYVFVKRRECYAIPFQPLKRWAFHEGRIYAFPEREQKQSVQLNDTWGRCVPVATILAEVRGVELVEL